MRRNESVKQYFNDMMRLFTLARTPDEKQKISFLNGGVPHFYQSVLIASRPKTTDDWIDVALDVEKSNAMRDRRQPATSSTFNSATYTNSKQEGSKQNYENNSKPTPTAKRQCPRCRDHGFTEYHAWQQCPREDIRQKNSKTPAAPKNGGGGSSN